MTILAVCTQTSIQLECCHAQTQPVYLLSSCHMNTRVQVMPACSAPQVASCHRSTRVQVMRASSAPQHATIALRVNNQTWTIGVCGTFVAWVFTRGGSCSRRKCMRSKNHVYPCARAGVTLTGLRAVTAEAASYRQRSDSREVTAKAVSYRQRSDSREQSQRKQLATVREATAESSHSESS